MKLDRIIMIVGIIGPLIAFIITFYADQKQALADVEDLKKERSAIIEKLDKISEKINIIDGKISEHFRGK